MRILPIFLCVSLQAASSYTISTIAGSDWVGENVPATTAILIQADKFGSSIAQALRVQSDSMRTRRKQMAEEKAAKTAVKLIFPLVIFIFPAIFVVLVGPAAITIVNEMFPMMNGQK